MAKKYFEFDTRYSDIEQSLEERKNRIKTICFKTCPKCGEIKPVFRFSIDKRNTDGRLEICKECRSREYLKYYYQNRNRILIKVKEYQDNHKKAKNIYNKNYREKNEEKLKKNARKWYMSNKKAIKKRNLKYYQENLEACQIRRKLWIEKNKERIREYNREYNRKHKVLKR
ncbi:hypothetical protein ES705_18156 [subsurface metagenome]|jgi:hypothetical protein|nr:MAG: hypothetical protein ES695_00415 [Candidatus Atribacteria bacterium 1244-E10-H5-B2]